jgi:hypothetical protein
MHQHSVANPTVDDAVSAASTAEGDSVIYVQDTKTLSDTTTERASIRPTPRAPVMNIDHLDAFVNKTDSISNALSSTAAFRVCTSEAMRSVHESNGTKGTMVKLSSTSLFAFEARNGSAHLSSV